MINETNRSIIVGVGNRYVDSDKPGFGRISAVDGRQYQMVVSGCLVVEWSRHGKLQRSVRTGSRHQTKCIVVITGQDEVVLVDRNIPSHGVTIQCETM